MKNKSLLIIVIQSILIITLIWIIMLLGKDEFLESDDNDNDNDETIVDYTIIKDGLTYINLPALVEKNSGIKLQKISISTHEQSIPSYGITVNLSPLLKNQNDFTNLKYQKTKLLAKLDEEAEQISKLIILNKDNKNIADSVVQEKNIEISDLKNDIAIINNNIKNLLSNIDHRWGKDFKELIADSKNHYLEKLLHNEYRLIKITIPINQTLDIIPKEIKVSPSNQPKKTYKATFISKAQDTDQSIQGKSFYYYVTENDLEIGLKLKAFIVSDKIEPDNAYLFIPKESVIWSSGKAWVFIKNNEGNFLRKPLPRLVEIDGGWIIKEGIIIENDKIVVDGAQLLLSEEFKYQIKNENED